MNGFLHVLTPQLTVRKFHKVGSLNSVTIVSRKVFAQKPISEPLFSFRFADIHNFVALQEHINTLNVRGASQSQ